MGGMGSRSFGHEWYGLKQQGLNDGWIDGKRCVHVFCSGRLQAGRQPAREGLAQLVGRATTAIRFLYVNRHTHGTEPPKKKNEESQHNPSPSFPWMKQPCSCVASVPRGGGPMYHVAVVVARRSGASGRSIYQPENVKRRLPAWTRGVLPAASSSMVGARPQASSSFAGCAAPSRRVVGHYIVRTSE